MSAPITRRHPLSTSSQQSSAPLPPSTSTFTASANPSDLKSSYDASKPYPGSASSQPQTIFDADADSRSLQKKSRSRSPSPSRLKEKDHSYHGSGPAGRVGGLGGGKRSRGARSGTTIGLRKREWYILSVVSALGVVVRFWNLGWPDSVVFDEVHFGGFAAKYIRQAFFMDVHPPLAKMLITLAAFVGGFDGNFDFKDIGKDYIEPNVPYIIMRSFPALLGLALIPLTFLTLINLRMSLATALLGSLLITFENALIAQSRLILLDSFLLFFTGLTTFFWVRFSNFDSEGGAFTPPWWRNLTLTGLALGAVVSCKWVGLFTIAMVGLGTLRQLWLLLGNLKVTPRMWIKHFAARTLCLIVVPATFYMFMFQIHFWILTQSGEGDGFMSSEFQHTLSGHGMEDTYAGMSTLREGTYIRMRMLIRPALNITLYPHRDENNDWRITNGSETDGPTSYPWAELPFEQVIQGARIRLEHVTTLKRLHSHDHRPPVSEVDFQNEVSGYGFEGFAGDANDDFIVEIAHRTRGRRDRQAKHRLKALRSEFRLRHALSGCYLFSHKVKLPEWAFEQQEVTCNKNPTWENSLWYIETNNHPQLDINAEKVNYQKPSFFAKFFELQAVMWRTNAGLTERHAYDSRPQAWPVMRRGINFWVKDHKQVYLIGNPVVWWSSTAAVVMYLAVRGLLVLREKRGFRDLYRPKLAFYDEVCSFTVIGWGLHYLPFFLMQRQLFLHHYLPALYFAVLCFCSVFDFITSSLRPRTRIQVGAVILVLAVWSFSYFSPLTYAQPWTQGKCTDAKWLKTWDFSCADFHENLSMYQTHLPDPIVSQKVEAEDPAAITTTFVEEAPEPIHNAFEEVNPPSEEKTIDPVGPKNEVQMAESTATAIAIPNQQNFEAGLEAEKPEDTRAPVGLDAGAPAVTADAEDDGWHGGAEDDGKRQVDKDKEKEKERQTAEEPKAGEKPQVEVKEMELDDEAKRLAREAMKAVEESVE